MEGKEREGEIGEDWEDESILRKQGLIIEQVEKGATGTEEHKPAEPAVKYYGKETLATVWRLDMEWYD